MEVKNKEIEHKEMENKDTFLNALLNVVSKDNETIDLTLNIGGSIVTGTAISTNTYFSLLSKQFKKDSSKPIALAEYFEKISNNKADIEKINVNYIHLRDVTIFSNNNSYDVQLWRGKISSVDGFTFEFVKK